MQVIQVAIGISFVYLLFSILATAFNELVAGLFGLRGGTLRRGIAQLLSDDPAIAAQLQKAIYSSPVIKGLSHGTGWRKEPSYIDKDVFAAVLIAALKKDNALPAAAQPVASTSPAPGGLDWTHAVDALSTLSTGETTEHWLKAAAAYFDNAMDRVSGAYKRLSQVMVLVFALATAVAFNVDTIAISRSLWTDPKVRAAIADNAASYSAPDLSTASNAPEQIKQANERYAGATRELEALDLPLGWPGAFWSMRARETGLAKVFGLALSVLAISLGAPFWFEVLGKLASLRAAGQTPDEKRAKAGGHA